jgi:hypothetical protein
VVWDVVIRVPLIEVPNLNRLHLIGQYIVTLPLGIPWNRFTRQGLTVENVQRGVCQ